METPRRACRGIFAGSGVVHTTREPIVHADYLPQYQYQKVVISADKGNAGMLHVYHNDSGERLSLPPGKETRIDVSSIHCIHVEGDTEDTRYDWSAV
jgi:hypothetical protein